MTDRDWVLAKMIKAEQKGAMFTLLSSGDAVNVKVRPGVFDDLNKEALRKAKKHVIEILQFREKLAIMNGSETMIRLDPSLGAVVTHSFLMDGYRHNAHRQL